MGKRTIEIDLSRVTGMRFENSFLGKTKFRPLLVIEFTDEQGQADEAAWLFRDLDGAGSALEKACSRKANL